MNARKGGSMPMLHEAATRRLSALAPLDERARVALMAAAQQVLTVSIRRELTIEGQEIARPILLLEGWAARVRFLPDGRRQILSFILPGDIIGNCRQPRPLAVSTVVALTDVRYCLAPAPVGQPGLEQAYAISHALDEAYLLAQVTRLGRMTAHERIGDMLLELRERLETAGLVDNGVLTVPLTQEAVADATGLTSVHVNRTLQLLRREGEIIWKGSDLTIVDPDRLAHNVGRLPIRVTAEAGALTKHG